MTDIGVSIGNVSTIQKADIVPGIFEISPVKYGVTSDTFICIVIGKQKRFRSPECVSECRRVLILLYP